VKVILNVYDLVEENKYGYHFGFGVYHSGVQIFDTEYSYGGHEFPISGIFTCEPRHAAGARFREALVLGEIDISMREVQAIIEAMATEYLGTNYHFLYRNCNHFANDFSQRLLGRGIPGWINRLAKLGSCFQCLLPSAYFPISTPSIAPTQSGWSPFSGRGLTLGGLVVESGTSSNFETTKLKEKENQMAQRDKIAEATLRRLNMNSC